MPCWYACSLLLLPLEPLLEQHRKDCPSDHPLPLLVALRHGHYEAIEVLDLAGMSFNSDAGHCVFTRGVELLSVHSLAAQLGAHKALAIFIKGGMNVPVHFCINTLQGASFPVDVSW